MFCGRHQLPANIRILLILRHLFPRSSLAADHSPASEAMLAIEPG